MASSIALNLRKKVRRLQEEAAYSSPLGRCIVLEEETFGDERNKTHSYVITATYRKEPDRRRPLALVTVQRKSVMGIGYYNIIDNSKHCWDSVVNRSLTFSSADSKAFNRAMKIASWFSKIAEMPLINYTSHGGCMEIPISELIKRTAESAARSRV